MVMRQGRTSARRGHERYARCSERSAIMGTQTPTRSTSTSRPPGGGGARARQLDGTPAASRGATALHSLARKRQVGDPHPRGVLKGRHWSGPMPPLQGSGVCGRVTQGCARFAALPWAMTWRPFRAHRTSLRRRTRKTDSGGALRHGPSGCSGRTVGLGGTVRRWWPNARRAGYCAAAGSLSKLREYLRQAEHCYDMAVLPWEWGDLRPGEGRAG